MHGERDRLDMALLPPSFWPRRECWGDLGQWSASGKLRAQASREPRELEQLGITSAMHGRVGSHQSQSQGKIKGTGAGETNQRTEAPTGEVG